MVMHHSPRLSRELLVSMMPTVAGSIHALLPRDFIVAGCCRPPAQCCRPSPATVPMWATSMPAQPAVPAPQRLRFGSVALLPQCRCRRPSTDLKADSVVVKAFAGDPSANAHFLVVRLSDDLDVSS